MDKILNASFILLIVACLVEIASINFDGFKKEMHLKVNQ